MALTIVTFITVLPDEAFAGPCAVAIARTPDERAALWREALDRFSAQRPDLSAEQVQFLSEALRLGDDIAALRQDDREHAAFARKAARVMGRARELFSRSQVGELFSSMGQTQVWLAELAADTPYCNCVTTGKCQMPNGGPQGNCDDGCETWTGSDGQRRIGICSSAAETLE